MGELTREMERVSGFNHKERDAFAACGVNCDEVQEVVRSAISQSDATISKALEDIQNSNLSDRGKLLAAWYGGGFVESLKEEHCGGH